MKGGKTPLKLKSQINGYTIIEVMIVLAVSGMLFVIAANFINGKQANASFTSGVSDMSSYIQDIIDEVNDGKFSDKKLSCTSSNSNPNTLTIAYDDGLGQGVNPSCVFLGKLLISPVNSDKHKFQVASLAGLRLAESFNEAKVTRVVDSSGTNDEKVDLTVTARVPQNLEIASIKADGHATDQIGFTQSYGESDGENGYTSAVQNVVMRYGNNLEVAQQAVICLTDGTRYATITLGDNHNQLVARTKLRVAENCT